jgi:serine protease Do
MCAQKSFLQHPHTRKLQMQPRKLTLALAVAAALGAGGIVAVQNLPFPTHAAAAQTAVESPVAQLARPRALPDFASIVAQYGPAVVNISASGTTRAALADEPADDFEADPFFKFFRGLPFGQIPRGGAPLHGQGSGFIVSPDGVILTNAHVVRDASEVTVKLTDRREFLAKVVGLDPATDVAVLRVDAKNLPTIRIGNLKDTSVGDWVVAIGAPFGFENSVTAGIVSAKGRSLPGDASVPFIQTDVAVNPGNSGGPLFNLAGEVIGINSQIYSRSGGYQGLSFAIPIDVAARVKDQILATGHATHARLGVAIQEVSQGLADSFGLAKAGGALVSSVQPGSAAAAAGLRPGDVIVQYDREPIVEAGDLSSLVGMASAGQSVDLEVVRKGEKRVVKATLGKADASGTKTASAGGHIHGGRLGLAVRPLTEQESREAKVTGGLLVEGVEKAAERAGVQPGDIILSANDTPMKTAEQLREVAAHAPKSIALLLQRGDSRIFVPVKTG